MYKIKIDKGIPMTGGYRLIYPWKKMSIGDSFFVESMKTNLYTAAHSAGIKKVMVRTVTERGIKGRRVWRVG